jgi:hypothetical protein
MAITYEPIATTTLATAVSSVTFSAISGSYTDLVLVLSARSSQTGATDGLAVRVNSDTGSNYSSTYLRGDGTSATSGRNSSDTYYRFAFDAVVASGAASDTFSATVIHFMNYANATTNKTILGRANVAGGGTDAVVGLWRNTAAITSIDCIGYGGNLQSGSTFTLYGIASA